MNTRLQECYKSKTQFVRTAKRRLQSSKSEYLDRVADVTKLLMDGDTVHEHVVKVPGIYIKLNLVCEAV